MYEEYREDGYFDAFPPCHTCFPAPHSYNKGIYEVYSHVDTQLLFSPGGPVAISMLAVDLVLGYLDVDKKDRLWFQNKVGILANIVLDYKIQAAKAAAKAAAKNK